MTLATASSIDERAAPKPLARSWSVAFARARRAGVAFGDQAAVSGTNFLTGLIVGRATAPAEFGRYVMAFSLMLLLAEMLHALVSTPHGIFAPRLKGGALRRLNGSTLAHALGLGGICLIALAVASAAAFAIGGATAELGPTLLALAVSAWAILLRYYGRVFSFNLRRPAAALAVDGTVAVIQLGSLAALAYAGLLECWTAVLAVGVANLVAAAVWFALGRRELDVRVGQAMHDLRTTWRLSRWVFVSGLLWVLGVHAYPWLVGGLLGQEAAGAWGAAFGVAAVANPLLMGLQNVLGPAIAHAYPRHTLNDFRTYVLRATGAFAMLMLPFAAAAYWFGEHFVGLYGPAYAGYGRVAGVLGLACVAQATAFCLSRGLFAMHRAQQDTAANALVLIVLLAAGYPLIAAYGVLGAAVCLVASGFAGALYRLGALLFLSAGIETAAGRDEEAAMADGEQRAEGLA